LPWLTASEAASYLACPISRIRKLSMTGELPCHRDGRRVLFRRDELDLFYPQRRGELAVIPLGMFGVPSYRRCPSHRWSGRGADTPTTEESRCTQNLHPSIAG
jgi:excisionase family DNA binding protein